MVDGVTKRSNIKGKILCALWPPRLVKNDDGIMRCGKSKMLSGVGAIGVVVGDRWWWLAASVVGIVMGVMGSVRCWSDRWYM